MSTPTRVDCEEERSNLDRQTKTALRAYVRPSIRVSRTHSIVLDGKVSAANEFGQTGQTAKKSA